MGSLVCVARGGSVQKIGGVAPEARAAATRVIGANTENGVARWLAEHWRDWQ